jgi:hypothetical protein
MAGLFAALFPLVAIGSHGGCSSSYYSKVTGICWIQFIAGWSTLTWVAALFWETVMSYAEQQRSGILDIAYAPLFKIKNDMVPESKVALGRFSSQSLLNFLDLFFCFQKVVATNTQRVSKRRNKHFFLSQPFAFQSTLLPSTPLRLIRFAMDQAVFQTLTDTLSADTNTRLTAELRLKELQVNPGTPLL